ncbi:ATP-binding cassette domain-containing protein, partial [Citrobacter freundii]|uniref:ATP-binding cassette domain-containing protein n=1 Tax=Citrobacter freundii TaxID=546 RepID=UPI0021CA3A0B
MSKIVLEAKDVYKHFDDGKSKVEVIKGLSLQVEAGQFVSIVGASGSGKSTLLRCINFLEQPSNGTIKLNGEKLRT